MNTRPSVLLFVRDDESPAQLFDMHAGRAMTYNLPRCKRVKFSSDDRILYGVSGAQVFELTLDGSAVRHNSAASRPVLLDSNYLDLGTAFVSFDISPENSVIDALDNVHDIRYRRV